MGDCLSCQCFAAQGAGEEAATVVKEAEEGGPNEHMEEAAEGIALDTPGGDTAAGQAGRGAPVVGAEEVALQH